MADMTTGSVLSGGTGPVLTHRKFMVVDDGVVSLHDPDQIVGGQNTDDMAWLMQWQPFANGPSQVTVDNGQPKVTGGTWATELGLGGWNRTEVPAAAESPIKPSGQFETATHTIRP